MGQVVIKTKFGVSKTFGVHPLNESASKKRRQKKFPEKRPGVKAHHCPTHSTYMGISKWGVPVFKCNACNEYYT